MYTIFHTIISKADLILRKRCNLVFMFLVLPACLFPGDLFAQTPDFAAAEKYDVPNLMPLVGTTQVIPFFLKKSNRFWIIDNPPAAAPGKPSDLAAGAPSVKGTKGKKKNNFDSVTVNELSTAKPSTQTFDGSRTNYYLIDPVKKEKTLLFDKGVIVNNLSKLCGTQVGPDEVTYSPDFSDDEKTVSVSYKYISYDYDYQKKSLVKHVDLKRAPVAYLTGNTSPDKKWLLYARHHNLYLKKISDTAEQALSADGAEHFSFSINDEDRFADMNAQTDAVWSADSKTFYILRKDTRKVQTMTIINSLSSPRPYVTNYQYELPGDTAVAQYEFFVGNTATHTLKKVNVAHWPDQEVSLVRGSTLSNGEVLLLRRKRSRDEMDLCAVDVTSGKLHVVINEVSKPFINEDLFSVSVIDQGKSILWWSDRTGWGQYYRYDINGKLLNAVTAGEWTAGHIAATDDAKHCIYFYGYGKEKERNPNYAFLYKVNFNGSKEQLMTPEDATHAVFISPSKEYIIDNYSRINLEPRTVLRSSNGEFIKEIMKADLSHLYAYGWKQPEMFIVKAKDGVTDLYGLMWKPFNFDPSKKYPIISQVYPGPFTETVWTEFTVFDRYNNTSLAQTGFIVLVMGHRGSSPYRNAKYYKFGHGNLRDYALEDDKYGLEQLAARHSFIDLNEVGIFGHSGGGMMSAAALCTYPDFYKAAVSSSGNHDNTIYNRTWGESYQGFDQPVDLNQSLAKGLKGRLLLVSGESDQNVNVANTYRMADALIKADKDFDMLILPGQSHTYEEPYKTYFQKRLRAYFAKYLMKN